MQLGYVIWYNLIFSENCGYLQYLLDGGILYASLMILLTNGIPGHNDLQISYAPGYFYIIQIK